MMKKNILKYTRIEKIPEIEFHSNIPKKKMIKIIYDFAGIEL